MKSHAFWKCWNQNAVLCRHELFIPTLQACVVAWVRGGQKQNGRFTHRSKQTNKCTFPLTWRSACGSERKVAVLVPIGPRWRFIQNDRQDPYAGVLSKRPARSLFGHTSHLTALRPRLDAGSASPVYLRKNINTHDHWCGGYLSDNLNSIPLVYILDRVLLHA